MQQNNTVIAWTCADIMSWTGLDTSGFQSQHATLRFAWGWRKLLNLLFSLWHQFNPSLLVYYIHAQWQQRVGFLPASKHWNVQDKTEVSQMKEINKWIQFEVGPLLSWSVSHFLLLASFPPSLPSDCIYLWVVCQLPPVAPTQTSATQTQPVQPICPGLVETAMQMKASAASV